MPSRTSRSRVKRSLPLRASDSGMKYADTRTKKPMKNDWFSESITVRINGVPAPLPGSVKYQLPGPP